ncbi:hypothetical protein PG999_005828 [Apiospora kogelbergensis]|uniref:PAN domain-containing protein n=1 Tax=Apiospora kogelbergensis TaxID=1337665 RepID=A0AAW0QV39_9PEZI
MAFIHDDQPGLEVKSELQPGLEVVPEPEAPQVVAGPDSQKPWDQSSPGSLPHHQYHQYHQYQQATSPIQNGYDQSPYSPYQQPQSSHPAMSEWNGTVGPSVSERAPQESTVMGMRKKKFWLIIGPLIAVFVIGLAVGLGVGLGAQHGSDDASPSGGGTQDMGDFQTTTFEDCLNACAKNDACSRLGSSQGAPNWFFGVRQQGANA